MRTLTWLVVALTVVGLAASELTMQPTPEDRAALLGIFAVAALLTVAAALAVMQVAPRVRRLESAVRMVGVAAVGVAAVVVGMSAATMFISPHDRNLVLVALGLGTALGVVLAWAVARRITLDLGRLREAAQRVAEGDLTVRSRVERRDELGAAAAAFDRMVGRLQASEDERRVLLAAVGHDLRTPLASLQAAVEALQDGVAPDPDAYLRGMASDLDHLRKLVEDLFLLAQIEAGRAAIHPEPIDLAELADEAVEALTPLARRREVRLRTVTGGRVEMVGDPAALGRVLRNLVDNAVAHSPAGGEVAVEVWQRDGTAGLRVSDQGPGFPPGFEARAFELFTRAEESRSRGSGGTGLGLAIARGLVEAHGGSIRVEEGAGGRVVVTLPQTAPPAAAGSPPTPPPPPG